MNIDASSSFSSVMSFLKDVFSSVLSWMSGIKLAGNFSLLDLNVAFTVFGIIFTLLFTVVRSGVNNSISSVDRAKSESARDAARKKSSQNSQKKKAK